MLDVKVPEAIQQRLFTVQEYYRLADASIISPDEQVELIRGVVRKVSPKKRPHIVASAKVRQLFDRRLAGPAGVYEEAPVTLEHLDSEPQPDVLSTSNPDIEAYGTPATKPLLLIEISYSSVRFDLTLKAALYAEAGILDYWVVNLVARKLVIFREPRGARSRSEHGIDEIVTPLSWPDFRVEVAALSSQEKEPS